MIEERAFTYDELGALLGKGPEAIRQHVRRRRWRRTPGNDGKTRVMVPVDVLDTERADIGADVPPTDGEAVAVLVPALPPHSPPVAADVGAILSAHISRLEQVLETAREKIEALERERDEARADAVGKAVLAAQVEALNTVLAVERERAAAERARVEEWKAVADRFATQAETLAEAAEARRGWWPWKRRA